MVVPIVPMAAREIHVHFGSVLKWANIMSINGSQYMYHTHFFQDGCKHEMFSPHKLSFAQIVGLFVLWKCEEERSSNRSAAEMGLDEKRVKVRE